MEKGINYFKEKLNKDKKPFFVDMVSAPVTFKEKRLLSFDPIPFAQ